MNFAQVKGITIPQGAVKQLSQGQTTLWKKSGGLPADYRRLTGIEFDGQVWYDTNMYLQGSDTLKFAFEASIACNVLGCYTDASAQTNYSLYCSTSSTAKYLRYNGGTYNSAITANTRYDVTLTPTGSDGMKVDSTWTAKSFTTPTTMMIGTTSTGATSAKLTGALYGDIEVVGREKLIPVKRISDGKVGYWMESAGVFLENLGTGTPVPTGYIDPVPSFFDYLVFDGNSWLDTGLSIPANGSIRMTLGGETSKDSQRVYSAWDSGSGGIVLTYGGGTNATNRQMVAYYDSSNYLTAQTLAWSYTSFNFYQTPKRFGWGSAGYAYTKGNAHPSAGLRLGQWGDTHPAYTGYMKEVQIYGEDAQNCASFSAFDSYTPVYTLKPCLYAGQAGIWIVETSTFVGNAGGGTLSVRD